MIRGGHSQFGVMEKTAGRFDEVREEAMGVFALVVVELCHCPWVQVPVEKSAAVSPSAPVCHGGNIPGVMTQP